MFYKYRSFIITFFLFFLIFSANSYAAENELVWTGERSIYYGGIVGAAEEFTKRTGIKVTTIPGGCSTAAKGVKSGKVDVGGLCCAPKEDELKAGYKAYPLAYEALVIAVNKANPITNLTVQQVRDIFSGKIKNWKEVGGQDKPVKVVTRLHCKDRVGNWKQILDSDDLFIKDKKNVKEDQDVLLAVSNEPNSVGFISMTMANKRFVKILNINGIKPSRESLIDNTYPWRSTNYMITIGEPTGNKKKFIDFLFGEGRKYMSKDIAFVDEVKPVVVKKKGLKEKPVRKKL